MHYRYRTPVDARGLAPVEPGRSVQVKSRTKYEANPSTNVIVVAGRFVSRKNVSQLGPRGNDIYRLRCTFAVITPVMRTRKFFSPLLLLLFGPAALLLFPQLGIDTSPIRSVKDRYPVFTDVAVDPDANILAV